MNKRVEFTVEATKPNIAAPSSYNPNPELGLTKHNQLENVLVKPYSQLRIKEGWTFKGESFCEGYGGYGKVEGWNIGDTNQVEPMSLIQGDGGPFSYLQAAMLYRDIDEFGRFWHSTQWGVEEVLDQHLALKKGIIPYENEKPEEHQWTFKGKIPVNWNPSYTEKNGIVKITYYSLNPVHIETLIHNVHTFDKASYVQTLRTRKVGTGQMGIIF